MYKLALLFTIIATAQAQLISNGTCNFQNVVLSKNQSNQVRSITVIVSGFEIKRINNTLNTGQCTSVTVVWSNGDLSVTFKEVVDERLIEHNSTITPTENNNVYNVAFADFTSNFTIATYTNEYAVLYACSNQGQQKQEYAWVLGLNTTLTENAKNKTDEIIEGLQLSKANWVTSSHTVDSCRSGATSNLKISPIIVLIVGFVLSKVL